MEKSNSLEKKDQIPKEDGPEGHTGKVINDQNQVEGQKKQVNVESYSKVANLGQILKGLDFPAEKKKIIDYVNTSENITENKEEILSALNAIKDKSYNSASEIAKSAGLVYQ